MEVATRPPRWCILSSRKKGSFGDAPKHVNSVAVVFFLVVFSVGPKNDYQDWMFGDLVICDVTTLPKMISRVQRGYIVWVFVVEQFGYWETSGGIGSNFGEAVTK